eukprot:TRINITY_DN47155_c0_g1_i1.p1 TRINITY_DN47155_c0_g1~~TRINITY_DN47155_c0_g1_i1.p1  ORF type:complete len:351 (-),score=70.58 TRINITY_DN47155_c0_g1_i1:260-1312(-)
MAQARAMDAGLLQKLPEGAQGLYKEQMRWSFSLLWLGIVNAFLGIFFAVTLGLHHEDYLQQMDLPFWKKTNALNAIGKPFPSGRMYFPATISEMVSNPASPSGKCFLAFMTIASFALIFSKYATNLRSVSTKGKRCCRCFFTRGFVIDHVRVLLPSCGVLLVAYIYVVPANRTEADDIALWIHTIGAVAFIGGYGALEAYVLYLAYKGKIAISKKAFWMRCLCMKGLFIAGAAFEIAGLVTAHFDSLGICCGDVWRVPTDEDIQEALSNTTRYYYGLKARHYQTMDLEMLFNTADGWALRWKKIEFWGEVFSGLFMGFSLCAIFYYAEERQEVYDSDNEEELEGIEDDSA